MIGTTVHPPGFEAYAPKVIRHAARVVAGERRERFVAVDAEGDVFAWETHADGSQSGASSHASASALPKALRGIEAWERDDEERNERP